ncbi:MAG TPA: AraC family transcriptional regulator [Polyangiales bacterium]|nr:AraC family transcriptional regulator [Polyangiales bacterium]
MASRGHDLRSAFRVPRAPLLEVRDLSHGPLSVMELRVDHDNYGQSAPIPEQDAILVSLQLRANAKHEIWENGKQLPNVPVAAGTTNICDLRGAVMARSLQPFHCLNFTLPLRSLDESNEDLLHRFDLGRGSRQGVRDPVVHALGTALLPALRQPEAASRMFVDHVLFALRAHVAQRFGAPAVRDLQRGGLATWQERRAKGYIDARLAENVSLADVARECALSVAQFARAFKRSTGVPPYQYLTQRRLERARKLLLNPQLPLADVAILCGFADQSHFTKVFRRHFGVSPGSFRAASVTKLV